MSWPRDDAKLERVRALMAEHELDALVVRAPDNVLYLTNFWGMKGYDACVFPREGEPVLICLEASEEDAARTAWTSDVRLFKGYDERRSAPADCARPRARAARPRASTTASASSSRSGRRRPTAWSASRRRSQPTWFTAFGDVADATPLLAAARALKTEQEIERMRLANDIAAAAMEHCRLIIEPGMSEAQIAAEWEGFVHGEGTGWRGQGRPRARLLARLVGAGDQDVHGDDRRGPSSRASRRCSRSGSAPTATGATTRRTSSRASSTPQYRELEAGLMAVYEDAIDFARPGASLAELDRRIRAGIDAMGFPGQPSHPICHGVGARAHEPPYAHQAGGGEIAAGMVLAIEPGCYMEGGGGLRVEDNFLVTDDGAEKLSPFPDGIVQA